ncbi:hypothetical protein NBH00_04305 [Paraconexibacter antarcticus]|uniref:Uncharacterized protein n=1 Tax=Paraconexibacter antarcticus TaxID=2949664 RepID=A0ABY5DVC4_9ACTN|nr:hypothetical protein [Paraconexibacter antarcticus]UTI65440.1 hypothetical protein NBH00_04305 [Paraconexibacter antarcticus]
MTLLRTLRKLVLGETWLVPLAVAALVAGAALLRRASPSAWHDLGPVLLPVVVVAILVAAVLRTLPARR